MRFLDSLFQKKKKRKVLIFFRLHLFSCTYIHFSSFFPLLFLVFFCQDVCSFRLVKKSKRKKNVETTTTGGSGGGGCSGICCCSSLTTRCSVKYTPIHLREKKEGGKNKICFLCLSHSLSLFSKKIK